MSDTPRTDARVEVHDEAHTERTAGYNDLLEWARELEAELAAMKADYDIMARRADNEERASERAEKAEAELAEARAEVESWREAWGRVTHADIRRGRKP